MSEKKKDLKTELDAAFKETGRPQGVKEGLVAVQVVVERFLFRTASRAGR